MAVSTAVRWLRAWRIDGTAAACPRGGDLRSQRIEHHRDVILAAVDAQVDITLVELATLLRDRHGVSVAPGTIWRFLDRHDMTVKRNGARQRQERPDVARRRQGRFHAQPDPTRLVFIDETGASTNRARASLGGRAIFRLACPLGRPAVRSCRLPRRRRRPALPVLPSCPASKRCSTPGQPVTPQADLAQTGCEREPSLGGSDAAVAPEPDAPQGMADADRSR